MSADLFGPTPRVFSIAPGVAVLPALAEAIMARALVPDWPVAGDPLSLSTATINLPTRRAARALAALLAERAGGDDITLPSSTGGPGSAAATGWARSGPPGSGSAHDATGR